MKQIIVLLISLILITSCSTIKTKNSYSYDYHRNQINSDIKLAFGENVSYLLK
jgi:uncharacterized protein YceK